MFVVQAYLVASGIMAVCLLVEALRLSIKQMYFSYILVDLLLCLGLSLIWWFIVYLWVADCIHKKER